MRTHLFRFAFTAALVATFGIPTDRSPIGPERPAPPVQTTAKIDSGAVTADKGKVNARASGDVTAGTLPANGRLGSYSKVKAEVDVTVDPGA